MAESATTATAMPSTESSMPDADDSPGQAPADKPVPPDESEESESHDDPDDLRLVLVIGDYPPAQDQCQVDAIIDALGVERLAEIGVTIDSPSYLDNAFRLAPEERAEIKQRTILSCDLVSWLLRSQEKLAPAKSDCIAGQMTDAELQGIAEYSIDYDARGYAEPLIALQAAEDHCADLAVAKSFVRPAEVPEQVTAYASELLDRMFYLSYGRYEIRCFTAGIESTIGADEASLHLRLLNGELEEPLEKAVLVEVRSVLLAVEEVASTCLLPFDRLALLLWEADVRSLLDQCLRHELDHVRLSETMSAYGPALYDDDPKALERLAEGLFEVTETIQQCDDDGRYAERWREFLGLSGFDGSA